MSDENQNLNGEDQKKIEITPELQAHLDKVISDRLARAKSNFAMEKEQAVKEATKRYEGVDLDAYARWQDEQSKQKQTEKSEDVKLLEKRLADFEQKLQAEANETMRAKAELKQRVLESSLRSELTKAGVHPTRMDAALIMLGAKAPSKVVDIDDGGNLFGFDDDGSKSVHTVTEILTNRVKKSHAWLFEGIAASGGGAQGGNGQGPNQGAKSINRTDFFKLSPSDQMKHMKDGWKVVD